MLRCAARAAGLTRRPPSAVPASALRGLLPARAARAPMPRPAVRGASTTAAAAQSVSELISKLSTKPMVPEPPPLVLVISGASGVGKDSVLRVLARRRPELHMVVTATTRPPRPGEREGVDYRFVSRETFESWIERGELVEHALVYGQYKGVPKTSIQAASRRGADCVLRLDVQGAATIRETMPNVVSIFVVAESEADHARRLASRGTEGPEDLLVRLQAAAKEYEAIPKFDYTVVNRTDGLDAAVRQIEAIIDAEKARVRPAPKNDKNE